MRVADAILQPYVDARTLPEAAEELDRLAGRNAELPVPLGDLYDELAEAAANDDEYELAARLEAKAIEAGCRKRLVAREMRGWYLLKSGATEEGEALFRELLKERPDDAEVRITLGHARSDAGLQDAALDAFDHALAAAKRRGYRKEIDRARVERRAEREHVGLELDEDDRLAPPPTPTPSRRGRTAWAVAWFPPNQRQAALAHWPDLADDLTDPDRYAVHIETQLRSLHTALGHRPAVAPIVVDEFIGWAAAEGYDAGGGEARSVYAAEITRTGRAIPWPPGRNEPCWCGSERKYKRCCGRA
jgi:tetratricopeptide (TPR) repeat protein